MLYPQLPAVAFIAATLILIPLPWHWRARNVATIAIIAWLFAVDIIYGVNSILWAGNVNIYARVWCDISSKIVVGASFALPLASLCVCKHLEMVSSSRKVRFDNADKRRRMIFESIMCFGVPVIFMALHYIVQGHRFDIVENIGCQAAVYISIQAVLLMWFPPLLISLITMIYAAVALHHFIQRRMTFAAHLQNSNSALTTNRYLRLIAMSLTEIVWNVTFTAVNLWSNVLGGVRPWTNWADVHSDFGRIGLYPTVGIPQVYLNLTFLFWWTMPASTFIFFIFFGFGEEAKKEYKTVWAWFKTTVLRRPAGSGSVHVASSPKRNHRRFRIPTLRTLELGLTYDEKDLTNPMSPSTEASSSWNDSKFGILPHTPLKNATSFAGSSYYLQSSDSVIIQTPASSYHHLQHASSLPSLPSFSSVPEPEVIPITPPYPYHRPFSPPSVYPTHARVDSTAPFGEGIKVTIHRQAEIDQAVDSRIA